MIITEILNDGVLIKHYSDQGFMLLQNETGLKYLEPIDINPCSYTYIETDELAEQEEDGNGEMNDIEQEEDSNGEMNDIEQEEDSNGEMNDIE
jgi:hypothetical protein